MSQKYTINEKYTQSWFYLILYISTTRFNNNHQQTWFNFFSDIGHSGTIFNCVKLREFR